LKAACFFFAVGTRTDYSMVEKNFGRAVAVEYVAGTPADWPQGQHSFVTGPGIDGLPKPGP